ncbi:MAG: WD40/YVTN/BNR-like repeat-containing protein, partial [Vicinamibacteria bacterium]
MGIGNGGTLYSPVIDPTNPDTVYLGSDVGGVFRTGDGGRSWRPINESIFANRGRGWFSYTMPALAVDPCRPATIYAAGVTRGIFKSRDRGESWEVLGTKELHETYGLRFRNLAIDPVDCAIVYALLGGSEVTYQSRSKIQPGPRVFRSRDGGRTWSAASSGIDPLAEARSIVFLAGSPRSLLVSTTRGVYSSSDGGSKWTARNGGLPTTDAGFLAVGRDAEAERDVVYLTLNADGAVYKSVDGGLHWRAANGGLPVKEGSRMFAIAVDPRDARRAWTGSARHSTALNWYRTTDGGESWEAMDNVFLGWLRIWQKNAIGLSVSASDPSRLYLAGDLGVFRSDDGGDHWTQVYTREMSHEHWSTRGLDENGALSIAFSRD